MGELALTDNVPQEQPEASGRGADCWGTCEELLLVSAVRRHGTSNWNLIASELKDRAISLSVCPVYFSEEACKQKYDSLRGRYGSSNNMHWFEELRKLRVAHLKRELELYDGSIGSLQVKIKRLKAEKAQDMLLSKQAGITVAKAQSNDSLLVTMSHEIHVSSSPSDERKLHNVAHSVPQEGENAFVSSIAELDSKQKDGLLEESVEPAVGGHEAGRTEFLSADEDTEMLQSEDVQQDLDAEVLPQGSSGNDMILAQVEGTSLPAASELDSVRDKDADDELLAASEQIDVPDAEPVPSSPLCLSDRRYDLLIRRHMDLTIVRGRLEEGVYSGSREFFRDLLLIFNNALVYYPSESSEFSAAKALRAEATREMERIFRMEALLNQDGPATGTRESKKPKSGEGGAVPIVSGSPALVGGSVTGVLATAVVPSLDKASRKRSGSRAPIAVETSCSETLVDSEAAGARSGSANVVNAPSSGRAGEAAESQEDEEVNGRFKDTKSLHKGGSGRGKVPREELLEGILSKNASNKGLGRVKLRGMKVDDSKKSGAPYRAVGNKIKEEREDTEKKKGKERDEIGDNDLLRKGKNLTKLKDRDVMREREGESKAVPTRKAPSAPRPPSNSHDTISQTVVRPARGVRKPVNSTKEPARVPEQQPKKRVRK
ncbi:unnamed protein product [Sphagnum compactum]